MGASGELRRLARRAGEVLAHEGARGLLARARRHLGSDERRVFAQYPAWLARHDRETPPTGSRPLISVVTPVKDPPLPWLQELAESLLGQTGARLEWCIADDASEGPEVRRELSKLLESDARVRLVRLEASRGISGATNAALEQARGDLVAFVDHDDRLHPDALAWMQRAFDDAGVGAAYSDEDKLDAKGARRAPFFKPSFSADLLLARNFVSHLFVVRHALVRELGFLRPTFDGAQDHDLALRVAERARIAHVPRILYHWRETPGSTAESATAKPWAHAAGLRAVQDALERRGDRATVEVGPWPGAFRVRRETHREPLATRADDVVIHLGPGLELAPGAREELVAHALRPGVAFVAPRVLDARGKLESCGLTLGFGPEGVAACPFRGRPEGDPGYFGLARATRDISAFDPAAYAIERSKLETLAGPLGTPSLETQSGNLYGVSLAAAARSHGLRTIYAGEAIVQRTGKPPRRAREAPPTRETALSAEPDPHLSRWFRRGADRLELDSPRIDTNQHTT